MKQMNKSNLTKIGTFFFALLIVSVVGYPWYHHRRDEQAKQAWHDLENKLDTNADIRRKKQAYESFIQKWEGTLSSSTACYQLGKLYAQGKDNNQDYNKAIKCLTRAKFAKGSITEAERQIHLAKCYQKIDKLEKALTAYDHVIAHAPAYGCKIEALWAKANIYATAGRLQDQAKQRSTLKQITLIPLEGIKGDTDSMKIRNSAVSMLTSIEKETNKL